MQVHAQRTRSHLNVIGRGYYYISEGPVDLGKGQCDVTLNPASLMQVQIGGATGVNWKDLVLLCESRLGRERARLEVILTRDLNWSQVVRYASFLLPRGRAHLSLWNQRTGRVIAAEDHDCAKPNESVVLEIPAR